jgi:hypothetical protein
VAHHRAAGGLRGAGRGARARRGARGSHPRAPVAGNAPERAARPGWAPAVRGAILLVTPWTFDSLRTVVTLLLVASTAATALGFLLLGIAVVRHDVWRGATRLTLPVAAAVTVAWAFFLPLAYALWSLVLLGLASGLTSRRAVANAGVPQGAAAA